MADIPVLIVVTGPPGAGKTTITAELRTRLGLPLIAKDTVKELLGGAFGIQVRDRSQLGEIVFELIALVVKELLEQGVSVIAEGNFTKRSTLLTDLPPAEIVQVHVANRRRSAGGCSSEPSGTPFTTTGQQPTRSPLGRPAANGHRSRSPVG